MRRYSAYFCPENASAFYNMSFVSSRHFDVGWASGVIGHVAANRSREFYGTIMSNYSSLVGFEVDFMDFNYLLFNDLVTDLTSARVWAKGMADAARERGLGVQYCMGLPSWALQTLEFPAVTNARASEDNFPGGSHASKWAEGSRWQIGYTSLLLNAIRLRPFLDVTWSQPSCPGMVYPHPRDNLALQLAVAVLSAGPVGIGDGPNCTNRTLVMATCNEGGRLLHPTRGATPIDAMYTAAGAPSGQVWATHSAWPTMTAWTVLAVDVDGPGYNLTREDLYPAPAPAAADAPPVLLAHQSSVLGTEARPPWPVEVMAGHPLQLLTPGQRGVEHAFRVITLTPVMPSGWAFLGETEKAVALSPRRVVTIATSATDLTVGVVGVAEERILLQFAHRDGAEYQVVDVEVVFTAVDVPVSVRCSGTTCRVVQP